MLYALALDARVTGIDPRGRQDLRKRCKTVGVKYKYIFIYKCSLETTHGLLVNQYMGLYKSCHNGPLLKALNIDRICDVINNKVLGLFNQIFTICNSPVYELNCFFFPG